jgi:Caspase domain
MGRFLALLVGIAEYDDPTVPDLPSAINGVSSVGAALASRGYVLAGGPAASGRVTRTDLLTQVQRFLQDAEPGDTLLVFVSGHGAHSDGTDYLVPSDAHLTWPRLADLCVPLDAWDEFVENTTAAAVVFLVDASREGFLEQAPSEALRAG